MAGILLNNGQTHMLAVLFKSTAVQDYYLALITSTSNPTLSQQIGSGITEVSGTSYARIALTRNTDWTASGTAIVTSAQKTFTVGSGGWSSVNGYAVCLSSTATTGDAIFAEAFSAGQQGNKTAGDTVKITIVFDLKDVSE
jgi:hypothetical protein